MRILFVDLNNIIHLCRTPNLDLSVVNGGWGSVQQFYIILNSYLKQFQPDSVVIADDSYSGWRREKYPNYKKNRIKSPDQIEPIILEYERNAKEIKKSLSLFPFHYLKCDNLEADDLIYLGVKNSSTTDEKIVLSGDYDLTQVLKFENTIQFHPIKKINLPIPDYDIVRYKCLVGDSSDNIKGIHLIGPVKAKKILTSKKTFNEWYQNLDSDNQELYQKMKDIIDLERIPEEYIDEYNHMIEKDQKKCIVYNEDAILNYCEEKNINRFNIQIHRKLYQNLN